MEKYLRKNKGYKVIELLLVLLSFTFILLAGIILIPNDWGKVLIGALLAPYAMISITRAVNKYFDNFDEEEFALIRDYVRKRLRNKKYIPSNQQEANNMETLKKDFVALKELLNQGLIDTKQYHELQDKLIGSFCSSK